MLTELSIVQVVGPEVNGDRNEHMFRSCG